MTVALSTISGYMFVCMSSATAIGTSGATLRSRADEVVQFTEPKKGTYKKLIIRNGRLLGSILLGDISKSPYLTQAFDRNTPLPEERLSLLFDIGAPAAKRHDRGNAARHAGL